MNDDCKLLEKQLCPQIHISLEERLHELRKHGNIYTYKYQKGKKKKKLNEWDLNSNEHILKARKNRKLNYKATGHVEEIYSKRVKGKIIKGSFQALKNKKGPS